jgi:NAD-dependent dihydropyrimidine dehydrogenase PreA subunit
MDCIEECPENALTIITENIPPNLVLDQSLCSGMACKRCERACPEDVLELNRFFIT